MLYSMLCNMLIMLYSVLCNMFYMYLRILASKTMAIQIRGHSDSFPPVPSAKHHPECTRSAPACCLSCPHDLLDLIL